MQNKIVLLATHNKGKVLEMRDVFSKIQNKENYQAESLDFLPFSVEDIEETGTSFEENALLKARHVAKTTGYIALADDSGLEVDSLKSAPGIYSARYAQMRNNKEILDLEGSKDYHNILQVLKDMQNFNADEERKARFCSCLAMVFVDKDKEITDEIVVHGYWEGYLTKEIIGSNGFGYDPIFFDPLLQKTAAELTKDEKMKTSHRAKAIQKLLEKLNLK